MTTAELDARARGLRAKGLTYREVGEAMGESKHQAWKRCNREKVNAGCRRYKATHRERMREYDREYSERNRHTCPDCGHVFGKKSSTESGRPAVGVTGRCCPGCARARRERIVAWWAEGLSMREIRQRLGWTQSHLAVEMFRMREVGYDLPYRRNVFPTHGKPRFPGQVAA